MTRFVKIDFPKSQFGHFKFLIPYSLELKIYDDNDQIVNQINGYGVKRPWTLLDIQYSVEELMLFEVFSLLFHFTQICYCYLLCASVCWLKSIMGIDGNNGSLKMCQNKVSSFIFLYYCWQQLCMSICFIVFWSNWWKNKFQLQLSHLWVWVVYLHYTLLSCLQE